MGGRGGWEGGVGENNFYDLHQSNILRHGTQLSLFYGINGNFLL